MPDLPIVCTLTPDALRARREVCCRFLCFTIAVEPDEVPLTLDLTGPPGTREFVVALFET